jgi:hypothetical protein
VFRKWEYLRDAEGSDPALRPGQHSQSANRHQEMDLYRYWSVDSIALPSMKVLISQDRLR